MTDVAIPDSLPPHWQSVSMKWLLRFRNGADYQDVVDDSGAVPVIGSGGEFARASAHIFDGESVLFGRKGTVDRPLHIDGRFWTVDTMYYTELGPRIFGRFLYYFARTIPYNLLSTNTALPSMTQSTLGAVRVPLPPIEEQRAIADFLDRETAQIDAMVDAQERLVSLLEERRRSAIDTVVWQGFDGAAVSPSGVEPAPPSPRHWQRLRNKVLFTESQALSTRGDEELLTVSHITGVTPRSEKVVNMTEALSTEGYRLVQRGDLIINTLWAWMGALGTSDHHGIVSPAYGVYRPRAEAQIDPWYFHYLYRSTPYITEMTRHSTGIWSSRLRLYPATFLALQTVAPPLDEQRRIVRFLDEATSRADAMIAKAQESIALMKERRSALITAAVAGRIDVRTGVEHIKRELEEARA